MIAIKGRIVDCTGADPIENGIVIISNDHIVEVGKEKDVKIPSDSNVIDASGKTIIPGLIDCHTHFCSVATSMDDSVDLPPKSYDVCKSTLYGVENAKRWLNAGVTTVRDIGCKHRGIFALREEIEAGRILGPTLILGGRIITQSGRSGSFGVAADGANEVRRAARQDLGAGAEWVKVYASGGGSASRLRDPWDVWMTTEEIAAACDEAHSKGMKAAAHAVNAESAMRCVKAGIDSIEHGVLLDDEVLEAMRKHNVYYCPTAYYYHIRGEHPSIPEWIRKRISTELLHVQRQCVKKASEIGVKLVAGTDMGAPSEEGLSEPDALAQELMLRVKYGLSPMHVLMSSTRTAAEMLGVKDKVGTLEKGKLADVVVVEGDPLKSMEAVLPENVWLVMKKGITIHDGYKHL